MIALYLYFQLEGLLVKVVGKLVVLAYLTFDSLLVFVTEIWLHVELELVAVEPGAHWMEFLDAAAIGILSALMTLDEHFKLLLVTDSFFFLSQFFR